MVENCGVIMGQRGYYRSQINSPVFLKCKFRAGFKKKFFLTLFYFCNRNKLLGNSNLLKKANSTLYSDAFSFTLQY
jgi:hypothetical protein